MRRRISPSPQLVEYLHWIGGHTAITKLFTLVLSLSLSFLASYLLAHSVSHSLARSCSFALSLFPSRASTLSLFLSSSLVLFLSLAHRGIRTHTHTHRLTLSLFLSSLSLSLSTSFTLAPFFSLRLHGVPPMSLVRGIFRLPLRRCRTAIPLGSRGETWRLTGSCAAARCDVSARIRALVLTARAPARPTPRRPQYTRKIAHDSATKERRSFARSSRSHSVSDCGYMARTALLRSRLLSLAGAKWRPPAARVTRARRPMLAVTGRAQPTPAERARNAEASAPPIGRRSPPMAGSDALPRAPLKIRLNAA